jgi:hypothetical protein
MTAPDPDASRQAVVEAALVLLERMGLTPADLAAVRQDRPKVPTFAEYIPVVSAAVSAGTRRAYGSTGTGSSSTGHLAWVETLQVSMYWIRHHTDLDRAELRLRCRRGLRRPRGQRERITLHGRHGDLRPGWPARGGDRPRRPNRRIPPAGHQRPQRRGSGWRPGRVSLACAWMPLWRAGRCRLHRLVWPHPFGTVRGRAPIPGGRRPEPG